MLKNSEVIDITGYSLILLEKNKNGVYPFPRTRYGILPYYINSTGEIVWGCIESNRIEPITLAPAAGTQDIIAIKGDVRLVLEAGKPLPDLNVPGLMKGNAFRDQIYQDTIECLITNGFNVYLENPLATATHEACEEHGISLCKTSGVNQSLLKKPLELSLPIVTEEHPDVASLCVWFAELTHCDSVILRYTDKTDTKMRRNYGRKFYEKGCWVTLDDFKTKLNQEKEKFSLLPLDGYEPVKIKLIAETFKAFELNCQLLERIESGLRKTVDNQLSQEQQTLVDELAQSPHNNVDYENTADFIEEKPMPSSESSKKQFNSFCEPHVALTTSNNELNTLNNSLIEYKELNIAHELRDMSMNASNPNTIQQPTISHEHDYELEKTIDKHLTRKQQALVDDLVQSLFNIASQLNITDFFKGLQTTPSSVFFSKKDKSPSSAQSVTLTTSDKKLNALISPLIEHINAFMQTYDLKTFKTSYEKTLKDTMYGKFNEAAAGERNKSSSFFIKLYDAIIYLFRAFFRLFDYLVTAISGASKLMRDTETPLAKKITGKSHFFEYHQAPTSTVQPAVQSHSAEVLQRLSKDFSNCLEKLEALTPSTTPISQEANLY